MVQYETTKQRKESLYLKNTYWPLWGTTEIFPCKNEERMAVLYHDIKYSKELCGNKMPTKCNRGFYCRSYCLLNMFRAPLCPSSGAQEYIQWFLSVVFRAVVFKLLVWCGAEGCVRFAGCCSILQTGHITLSSTPDQVLEKPQHEIPQTGTTV